MLRSQLQVVTCSVQVILKSALHLENTVHLSRLLELAAELRASLQFQSLPVTVATYQLLIKSHRTRQIRLVKRSKLFRVSFSEGVYTHS